MQEVYDWEMMKLMENWEQQQLEGLEGIVGLEQLFFVQDELQRLRASVEGEQTSQEEVTEDWVKTQLDNIGTDLTQESLDSILYDLEQMQHGGDVDDKSGSQRS